MALFNFLKGQSEADRFAEAVLETLRSHDPAGQFSYDKANFKIDRLDGVGGALGLTNFFPHWRNKAGRPELMAYLIDFVFESNEPLTFEAAAPKLMPIVRRHEEYAHPSEGDSPTPTRPFVGGLVATVAIDTPVKMHIMTEGQLADWGQPFEAVFERAVGNLRSEGPLKFEMSDKRYGWLSYDDYYGSSRLLLPELFVGLPVSGALVAVALSRTQVAFAGADEPSALRAMGDAASGSFSQEPRPLYPPPLILRDGGWALLDTTDERFAELHHLVEFDQALREGRRYVRSIFGERP